MGAPEGIPVPYDLANIKAVGKNPVNAPAVE